MMVNLPLADLISLLFAGSLVGLISGLLGIGGGIIVVPILLAYFDHVADFPINQSMTYAVASSLAVMVFTSSAAVFAHLRLKGVDWYAYRKLVYGLIVGVLFGSSLAKKIPTHFLEGLFAAFLLFIAYRMSRQVEARPQACFPGRVVNFLASMSMGLASGLLGVGGGTLIIPYLSYCGIDARRISAVSAACTLTAAAVGSAIFVLKQKGNFLTIPGASGYVYWPAVWGIAIPSMLFAPLGARLMYHLPVKRLRLLFVVILLITAVHLLHKLWSVLV